MSYGVQYPPDFLSSLPVLDDAGDSSVQPIRTLTARQYSDLHLNFMLSHPPDHVLFPFLHGLEGDNEAQNMFFASAGYTAAVQSNAGGSQRSRTKPVQAPSYRGLVTVLADEDPANNILSLSNHNGRGQSVSQSLLADFDDDLDDDEDDDLDEDEDDFTDSDVGADHFAMDVDYDEDSQIKIQDPSSPSALESPQPDLHNEGTHMHPVAHRPLPVNLPKLQQPTPPHPTTQTSTAHATSSAQDETMSSSVSTTSSGFFPPATMSSSTVTSVGEPNAYPAPLTKEEEMSEVASPPPMSPPLTAMEEKQAKAQVNAFLTSSVKPRDILTLGRDGLPQFIKPHVPEGISLRNFGIQVPIYASLSDFIVYSPKGVTPTAITLASSLQHAIAVKAAERTARLGTPPPVQYNVFILTDTAETLLKTVPHLVQRLSTPYCPYLSHSNAAATAAASGGVGSDGLAHTAVDFAQREKDEMRALTKASEILSIPNGGGQVYLGNAQDVPLPPDPASSASSANSSGSPSPSANLSADPFAPPLDPNLVGFDLCLECHDLAPFPSSAHLRAADDHLAMLDALWASRHKGSTEPLPPRPAPHPSAVIHLPCPSSPPSTVSTMNSLLPLVKFLERCLQSAELFNTEKLAELEAQREQQMLAIEQHQRGAVGSGNASTASSRRWSSAFGTFADYATGHARNRSFTTPHPSGAPPPTVSTATGHHHPVIQPPKRTRALKILLYSADGYTESSVPALILLMAARALSLPQAYLELQVVRGRSFFVYSSDLALLRRVDTKLAMERENAKKAAQQQHGSSGRVGGRYIVNGNSGTAANAQSLSGSASSGSLGRTSHSMWSAHVPPPPPIPAPSPPDSATSATVGDTGNKGFGAGMGRRAAKSVSLGAGSPFFGLGGGNATGGSKLPPSIPEQPMSSPPTPGQTRPATPEPQMSPELEKEVVVESALEALTESHPHSHSQSEVIVPAQSAVAGLAGSIGSGTMGGTVSNTPGGGVGSGMGMGMTKPSRPRASTSPWLVPGASHHAWFDDPKFDGSFPSRVLPFLYLGNLNHATNAGMLHALGITHVVSVGECALIPPTAGGMSANLPTSAVSPSLWAEERAGRIHVLDIKGVCDDGIDTLEPQLGPICAYIDHARLRGGHILVHCRVGVSRSATVVIAYVMQHLNLSLVDAYLIVRSRRLSVLIQPNMRLLYNLCGWEVRLARERAGGDEGRLREELCRALSWPCLAKEIHALNEKYLHN